MPPNLCKQTIAKLCLQRTLCIAIVIGMNEEQRDEQVDAMARTEERHRGDRVLDAGALRALAHPLRVKIYDILSQYGPQTASSLAERLGESSGSTSYHLRALAKHDLIRECDARGGWNNGFLKW